MSRFSLRNTKSAKVTPSQVLEIRQKYADGRSQGTLCREYGLSIGQVGRIVRRESWQVLPAVEEASPAAHREVQERLMQVQEQVSGGTSRLEEEYRKSKQGQAAEILKELIDDKETPDAGY